MKNKVYLIGIGGIGVSALARYYLSQGWKVSGSDSSESELITALKSEGCDIIIGSDKERITQDIQLVIYSGAVPKSQEELQEAEKLSLKTLKYNQALGKIANKHKLIAIAGTHGKSTTTSMISQILKNSKEDFTAVVGTILKEFDGKNFYSSKHNSLLNPHCKASTSKLSLRSVSHLSLQEQGATTKSYFCIEACEYKEHFLEYKPSVAVITNIEYDHADYFKTPENYIKAFEKFIENILPGGFCVLDSGDTNSRSLIGLRDDITYIDMQEIDFPEITLHIPGEHILFDAKLAYIVSHMIGIDDRTILETLEDYSGVWRRMEKIGITENKNILMSDYGHHPTEIITTLSAIKSGFPDKKLFVVFQPHQYSRTIELLDDFKTCFTDADTLIVPNIYESRDSDEDKTKMNSEIFVSALKHPNKIDGKGLENTLKLIQEYDTKNSHSSIILLLGAGDIDTLRYKIKTS